MYSPSFIELCSAVTEIGGYNNNKQFIIVIHFQETCIQCEWLKENGGQVLHMLYDIDIVDEESLLEFYEYLKDYGSQLLKYNSVTRFFEWLKEADEESDDSD